MGPPLTKAPCGWMWSYRMIMPTMTRRQKMGVSGLVYLALNSGLSTALWQTVAMVARQRVTFSWGIESFCTYTRQESFNSKVSHEKKDFSRKWYRWHKVGGGSRDGVEHGSGVGVKEGHFIGQLVSHNQVVHASSLKKTEGKNEGWNAIRTAWILYIVRHLHAAEGSAVIRKVVLDGRGGHLKEQNRQKSFWPSQKRIMKTKWKWNEIKKIIKKERKRKEKDLEIVKEEDKVHHLSELLGGGLLDFQILDGISAAEPVENLGQSLLCKRRKKKKKNRNEKRKISLKFPVWQIPFLKREQLAWPLVGGKVKDTEKARLPKVSEYS